jgi:hypothetical protein
VQRSDEHINLRVIGQVKCLLILNERRRRLRAWNARREQSLASRSSCLITFVLQDGQEVFFKIKKTTQLKKLMEAYCERNSLDMKSVRFLFDG